MTEIVTMRPEERILLIMADDSIPGTDRMCIYGFLLYKEFKKKLSKIEKRYGVPFYDDWEARGYGPYSEQLIRDIQTCIRRDLLEKQSVGNPPDDYSLYRFTKLGRNI